MTQVYSKALNQSIQVERVITKIEGSTKGPVVVFFGGIHGNETAGVFALNKVLNSIDKALIKGTIYGISGNLKALENNQRFISTDFNRMWTNDHLLELKNKQPQSSEEIEQIELYNILHEIIDSHKGPFYFIDLHTTSSKTLPFITINDAIINRKFSQQFPVPIVLGIEEYLSGPLLSYINTLGYVSIGFESGQHDEVSAIKNSEAFIYLALVYTNCISKEKIENFETYIKQLQTAAENERSVFEIVYLHTIGNVEKFKMLPGFKSFQFVKKGTALALSNGKQLMAKRDSVMFMPLYQNKGKDGYFLIRKIKPFFLRLSAFLRRIKADSILLLLPGITWDNKDKDAMLVNLKTTKYLAKPIFHLLGYRNRKISKTHLKIYNRERVSKVKMYKKEKWFKVKLS